MKTMSKYHIAIDLGASSGRVILARVGNEKEGCKVEMQTIYRFPTPMVEVGGKYYWNIYTLYDEIIKGLTTVGSMDVKVSSIGIDTWGVDFVPVAKDGSLLGLPRAYRDPFTAGTPERFFDRMGKEDLYNRTGIQIMNFNSVFQLYQMAKDKCSALEHAKKILFMPDALSYLLTGKMVCEYTILSTSALMDPIKKKLDKSVLNVLGLKKKKFADIVQPGHKIGTLTDALARKTGLGKVPVLAVAGHDTASAVAAVPSDDRNFAYLSSGTWSLMGIETERPVINAVTFEKNFTNEGGVNGTTRLLKNITGMWLLEQCLAQWKKEGREYSYEQIKEMASACPESKKSIDPDDPSFASPGNMPAAIISYCQCNGIELPSDDAHMAKLIFDSLADKYAEVFRNLEALSPFRLLRLHIIGGGAQNDYLNQLTANKCGIPVIAGPSEATALGNVMIQAGLTRKQILGSVTTKTYYPDKTAQA